MPRRLRVALLVDSHRSYERNLLRGIAAYARTYGPWSFYNLGRVVSEGAPAQLQKWGADGLIVRTENRRLMEQLREFGLPIVDLLGWYQYENVPAVDADHRSVSHIAADQLIERGFQQFAFCGFDSLYYSAERAEFFVEYLSSRGYRVHVFECPRRTGSIYSYEVEASGAADAPAMAAWIRSLPTPIGLMACNDLRGQQVIDICGECNVLVPEDVAVIGVGNDDVICELCDPTLSSVEPNTYKMGHESASLLHEMVLGRQPPCVKTLVEPLGAVLRQSTDSLSIGDKQITTALNFIRRHASDGIGVRDVLAHVQLSRSTFERRFMRLVGRSPKVEIIRMQLERVKQLLVCTDYRLAHVAELAGFNHVEYMCKVFKEKTGVTPSQYRKDVLAEDELAV